MRAAGVTGLLLFCSDYRCSHHIAISAEPWSDEVRLSDLQPRFICTACGTRGADIRPNFAHERMVIRKPLESPPAVAKAFVNNKLSVVRSRG